MTRRAWNSTLPAPTKPMERRTRIEPVNRERRKKLRAIQFGEKRDWIIRQPCDVTGEQSNRIHPAHTRTRAAGATLEDQVPLRYDVHRDFDCLSEARFEEVWGVTKEWIRSRASYWHERWLDERESWGPEQEEVL